MGVIPARSGSKGVPDKNVRPFAGKSLLGLAIEAARNSGLLSDTIVSTDSVEYARHAEAYGGKVPFIRPSELGEDKVPIWKVLLNILDYYEKEDGATPDLLVTLQPTSPLRTAEHIDTAINMIMSSSADALLSLSEAIHSPYKMRVIRNGRVEMFVKDSTILQRQEAPPLYFLNGVVYITKSWVVRELESLWSENTIPYVLPNEVGVNIDSLEDFEYAEWLWQRRAQCE